MGYLSEGYFPTLRCAHQVILDVGWRVAFVFRKAHVDGHLLASALHAQCLAAEERRSDLAGKLIEREVQRPGGRLQLELQLADARVVVGSHIVHASQRLQLGHDLVRDPREKLGIGMGKLQVDRKAQPQGAGRESQ